LAELGSEGTCPYDRLIVGGPRDVPDSRGGVLAKG